MISYSSNKAIKVIYTKQDVTLFSPSIEKYQNHGRFFFFKITELMGTSDKCLGIHPLTSNILEIMISLITIF